jgi:hypothetical protein
MHARCALESQTLQLVLDTVLVSGSSASGNSEASRDLLVERRARFGSQAQVNNQFACNGVGTVQITI